MSTRYMGLILLYCLLLNMFGISCNRKWLNICRMEACYVYICLYINGQIQIFVLQSIYWVFYSNRYLLFKRELQGVPWWTHCYYCDKSWIPRPGTNACLRHDPQKKGGEGETVHGHYSWLESCYFSKLVLSSPG